jgi:hypothetical protein
MFRMNTYKNKGLKVPLESTLTKKPGVGGLIVTLAQAIPNDRQHRSSASADAL